ncbi:hypothetical protein Ciccas_010856 [Cichlidogyrus casuarinus]|uniref:Uncharacterized protein n=1 Tax=Cichlidogyrus casuarinus TaxID=1844966 RepID=A0ABD2PU38_9PLAT
MKLMEVFKDCTNTLHCAILLLFGCRIDLKAPGLYRVTFKDPISGELSISNSLTFKFELREPSKPWTLLQGSSPLLKQIPEGEKLYPLAEEMKNAPVLIANLLMAFLRKNGISLPQRQRLTEGIPRAPRQPVFAVPRPPATDPNDTMDL